MLTVEGDSTYGLQDRPEEIEANFVRLRGSQYLVARRYGFVAFGGELPYDMLGVLGFDGVESPLVEVRFLCRPDRSVPITASRIRAVPIDRIVQIVIESKRTVFREKEPGFLVKVSDEDRSAVYGGTAAGSRFASRRRISDEELQQTADAYRFAVAQRQPPTAAVQRELRLPNRNVAQKWVQRARRMGYLEPAPGERQGGISR